MQTNSKKQHRDDFNEDSQKGQFPLEEDRLQVKPLSDECILAVMADGMGGLDHGEIAAEIAVNVIVSSLESKTQVKKAGYHQGFVFC